MKTVFKRFTKNRGLVLMVAVACVGTAWGQAVPSVQGTIRDAQTSGFLVDAVVALKGTPYRAKAGRDGNFRLDEVPAGDYTLTVDYVGFERFETDISVNEGETVRLPITMERVVRVADEIVVQGYFFGESKALNDQKEAANIKNVISEEQIQAFPDLNTAEVLQRVPGINIQRDNGEGRFVSMRGTPSAYTNVTVNGQLVAFSNADNRSVELDVVSAAQLSGIEVTKVLTPDMDADAVGGSINLQTRSAFDRDERYFRTRVGFGENSISDERHARLQLDYSDTFGAEDNFGFSAGFNFARTGAERHNNEPRWGEETDVNGNVIPFAQRDNEVQFSNNVRDRYGLNTQLEYKFNDNHRVSLNAVYNFREDEQDRQLLRVRWDRGTYITPTEVEDLRLVKSLNNRLEEQELSTYTLAGESRFGASTLNYSLSRSSAYTKKPEGQLRPEFQWRGVDLQMVGVTSRAPNWRATDPSVDVNDGSNYSLDVMDLLYQDTTSDIDSASVDFEMPMVWGSDTGTLKIGAKLRALSKVRADLREQYIWNGADDLTWDQFETNNIRVLESGYNIGPEFNADAFRDFFFSNIRDGAFELRRERLDVNLGEPYDSQEDVTSVYIMTTQEYGNLLVLGGFRYEQTDLDNTASNLVINDNEFVSNSFVNSQRSFNELYPNLQFRYRLTADTNVRLAYSESMARPDFFLSMPYSFTVIDDEEITRGNPDLDPALSKNFDFLAEHYFEGIGVLSGGVFFKQIDGFNFQTRFIEEGGEFAGFEVQQYVNGGSADLVGVELTWQQQFTQLPGWWSGFGIYANYTYTDATSIDLGDQTDRTDIAALPEQVQDIWNFALIYEKDRIMSRIAANYTGEFIEEVGVNADTDEWVDETLFVDFSFTYFFDNGLELFFQANNLTDEKRFLYLGVPTRSSQYEITGRTFNVGATWTF